MANTTDLPQRYDLATHHEARRVADYLLTKLEVPAQMNRSHLLEAPDARRLVRLLRHTYHVHHRAADELERTAPAARAERDAAAQNTLNL